MKVLIAHVRYRQRGGEDAVVEREARLLRDSGVDVETLIFDSSLFDDLSVGDRFSIAASQGDHAYGRSAMRAAIDLHSPNLVHAHNLFPLLGPGALREASQAGCATIHTWHNYRASCLAGTHLLRGQVCRLCDVEGRTSGVIYGCYRCSRLQSLAYERGVRGQMRALALGTPDGVLCLTDFQRRFYVDQGLPANRLLVKPNSVAGGSPKPWRERDGVVFVGRMSPEKGILGLVEAWDAEAPRLTVIGEGPLLEQVRTKAATKLNIDVRGALSAADARRAVRMARVLVFPSVWFEGLPLTVLESIAEGTPVVTFRGGAVEGVAPGAAAERGDFAALCAMSAEISTADNERWNMLSADCIRVFSEHYTDERNVSSLLRIYEDAISLER